jgi:hypothetical protein
MASTSSFDPAFTSGFCFCGMGCWLTSGFGFGVEGFVWLGEGVGSVGPG